MAGKPGMKGGGGARPGAGRKRKEIPVSEAAGKDDPKAFLISIMNDVSMDVRIRADAAKSLMPFVHQKLGEGGKKDKLQKDAEEVSNLFGLRAPTLKAVK